MNSGYVMTVHWQLHISGRAGTKEQQEEEGLTSSRHAGAGGTAETTDGWTWPNTSGLCERRPARIAGHTAQVPEPESPGLGPTEVNLFLARSPK